MPRKRSPPAEIVDETRAHDLLPAPPTPPPPPKRVAERRVVGYDTSERLLARRAFRPAGNSRRFWARVEEDDPFLVRRRASPAADELAAVSPGSASHDVYAADRLARVEPPAKASTRTRPVEGSHLPETRTAPTPKPPTPKPQTPKPPALKPPPPAPQPTPPAAPVDRRPPRIVNQPTSASPTAVPVQRRLVNKDGKSASEVRAEAERARAATGPQVLPTRSIDQVLSILGQLASSEQLFRQGRIEEATELAPVVEERPTARPAQRAAPPRPPPPPPPEPEPEEEEIEVPRPPARAATPPPLNRSPKAASQAATGGTLDDLFGQNEGRVKVGKRTTRAKPDEPG